MREEIQTSLNKEAGWDISGIRVLKTTPELSSERFISLSDAYILSLITVKLLINQVDMNGLPAVTGANECGMFRFRGAFRIKVESRKVKKLLYFSSLFFS